MAHVCLILSLSASAPAAGGPASKAGDDHGYEPSAGAFATVHGEVEPNDSPAQAQSLAVADGVAAALAAGDEDWYRVEATAQAFYTLSTSSREGSAVDTVLEVYDSDGTTLLAADDDGGMGLFSALLHFQPPTTVFYLRVIHFSPAGSGDYRVGVEPGAMAPEAPANDLLADAEVLDCGTPLVGTTVGAGADLGGSFPCLGFAANGPEVFYRLELPYSFQLTLVLIPDESVDLAVYAFTDPADPAGSCLAGSDVGFDGEAEIVVYVNENEDQSPEQVWVAVDSWSSQVAGSFQLGTDCEFVVPAETGTWGALKAGYR